MQHIIKFNIRKKKTVSYFFHFQNSLIHQLFIPYIEIAINVILYSWEDWIAKGIITMHI